MEDKIKIRLTEIEEEIKKKNLVSNIDENLFRKTKLMKNNFGLCLGGGGGKGAYQVGVFKALCDYGLLPKIKGISGASIGAINGLLFAMKDCDKAEKAWKEIKLDTVFEPDIDLIFNEKPGFFSRQALFSLIDKYVNYEKLKDEDISVTAVVSEKRDGKLFANYMDLNKLSKNDIKAIVSASSALPHIYENVNYKGKELVDGGITDNIPVKPLIEKGFDNIIVVGLNPAGKKNLQEFGDINFIEIYPSVPLGELIDGTLNFSQNAIAFREMLGYKDAIRAFKVYFEQDPLFIGNLIMEEEKDLKSILQQLKYDSLKGKIDTSINKIEAINNKYK